MCETMAVHEPRAVAARGGAADQKGIAVGLGKTDGSRPTELWSLLGSKGAGWLIEASAVGFHHWAA